MRASLPQRMLGLIVQPMQSEGHVVFLPVIDASKKRLTNCSVYPENSGPGLSRPVKSLPWQHLPPSLMKACQHGE